MLACVHVSLCVITRIHVGMERDGDKCYGCEQRKLNPAAGKPNTPWRAPILSECDQLAISVPDRSAASSASMTCMPATGATLVRDGWGAVHYIYSFLYGSCGNDSGLYG